MAEQQDVSLDEILTRRQAKVLGRKLFATRLSMAWERLVPLLWPGFCAVLLVLSATLLGVWQMLPGLLHLVLLAAAVIGCGWLLVRGLMAYRPVTQAEVDRRLEQSGDVHRPLTSVRDRLAIGADDDAARALWQAHRRRMAARNRAHAPPAPDTRPPSRDPRALPLPQPMIVCLSLAVAR